MKKVIVKRTKKFSGALVPYWVIVGTSKEVFSRRYGFDGDICKMYPNGFPISRIEVSELDRIGTRIDNGQTLEIEIADDVTNLFVSTMDGSLSNEIDIDEYITAEKNIIINTKGGFRTIPYPVIE